MVSFRHHLVTIVAIFLALAVGVALGAGPLRDGATSLLAGQNEELSAERDRLRSELTDATDALSGRDAVIDAFAGEFTDGLLQSITVAVLTLPGAEEDDVTAASSALTAAGAEVVSEAAISDAWAESDLSFRQSFASQVSGYLAESAPADATPEYILSSALAQVMSGGADAELIGQLLIAGDAPFVAEIPEGGADVLIVVGPRAPAELIDWAPVLAAFAATTHTVGIGDGIVLPARDSGSGASTLDSLPAGFTLNLLPFAVAAELAGSGGHWGVAAGAQSAIPPIPLAQGIPSDDQHTVDESEPDADEPGGGETDEATEDAAETEPDAAETDEDEAPASDDE